MQHFKFKKKELALFWYFLTERHAIWRRRFIEKKPWPWTEDAVMREYKFTNVYRQLDRVTIEWENRYARLLAHEKPARKGQPPKNTPRSLTLFHNVMFRLFNWPETYDALVFNMGYREWDVRAAKKILGERAADNEQIFTGAYIINGGGDGQSKLEAVCEAVDFVWKRRRQLTSRIVQNGTMKYAVEILQRIPGVGGFTAYEIACDLRFTRVLPSPPDRFSWANPGPGAERGIRRLLNGAHVRRAGQKIDYIAAMRWLHTNMPDEVKAAVSHHDWPFELREIEHSLCEFDKLRRVMNGEGRPRSRYRRPTERIEMVHGDDE